MNKTVAFLILAAGLGAGSAAFAQAESASGAQVVYDPATNSARVTDPLFQPQAMQTAPALSAEPIHLHMPRPHVVHHSAPVAAAAPAETPTADMAEAEPAPAETAPPAAAPAPAPVESAPLPPAPKPKVAKAAPPKPPAPQRQAKAAPPPQNMAAPAGPDAAIPFSMDSSTTDLAPEPPKHGKQTRMASTEAPSPTQDGKHVRIIFAPSSTEPTPETAASVASVAANINTGLRTSSDRVLLQAYGGSTNDKSSNARRLCLKRALSVRQLLIDAGIPSDRIDVRAMGGAGLGDPPDRVDMIVHG
ncbi:MAG TPA: OmpA family protein [Rhizomicrobium sp.]|jgi:outer membrane protein OmpA-like peptidoglycan-associated protein|nr:OmpA family protein [Rhizomicrobium sp.]